MHIETLKVFCDVAELGSFSKTAEKHVLSQSAVSQQLAQLETQHKCQLLDRKKRPIELTKEGQLLYQAAKDILERYEEFKSELSSIKSPLSNRINVAAIFSIGMHSLPNYVKRFMMKYPQVNMHIVYLSAEEIYAGILGGDIDVGLVAVPKRDKRLDVFEFEDEQLVFACSPKHSLADREEIDIHQLQFERFVSFERTVPTRVWIDGILQKYNVAVRSIMEFDNIETVKRAVEINSGVSILPEMALLHEVSTGSLRAIPFSNETFVRPTGIIVRKGKILTQASRYFIELLCERGGK